MRNVNKAAVVLLSSSIVLSMTACNKVSSKHEVEITEKQVVKAAQEFSDALINVDADELERLSPTLSEGNIEFLENFDYVELYGEESADVYRAFFSKIEYEVSDDVVIDGDKAEVVVKFKSVDYLTLEPKTNVAEDWVDAISDAEDYEETDIKFKFELSEDDEVLLANGDKVVNKFFYDDVANVYFYVDNYVFYEDAVSCDWSMSEYQATDDIEFTIGFSDEEVLENMELNVTVKSPSLTTIFEMTVDFIPSGSMSLSLSPADVNKEYFDEGYYTVVIDSDNGSVYLSSTVYVNEYVEPTPVPSNTKDGLNDYFAGLFFSEEYTYTSPAEDTLGSYNDDAREYVNEYFGLSFVAPENYYNELDYFKNDVLNNENLDTIAALFPNDDVRMMVIPLVTNIGVDLTSEEEYRAFLESNGGQVSLNSCELIGDTLWAECSSTSFYTEFLMTCKDGNLFVVSFIGSDYEAYCDFRELMQFN